MAETLTIDGYVTKFAEKLTEARQRATRQRCDLLAMAREVAATLTKWTGRETVALLPDFCVPIKIHNDGSYGYSQVADICLAKQSLVERFLSSDRGRVAYVLLDVADNWQVHTAGAYNVLPEDCKDADKARRAFAVALVNGHFGPNVGG